MDKDRHFKNLKIFAANLLIALKNSAYCFLLFVFLSDFDPFEIRRDEFSVQEQLNYLNSNELFSDQEKVLCIVVLYTAGFSFGALITYSWSEEETTQRLMENKANELEKHFSNSSDSLLNDLKKTGRHATFAWVTLFKMVIIGVIGLLGAKFGPKIFQGISSKAVRQVGSPVEVPAIPKVPKPPDSGVDLDQLGEDLREDYLKNHPEIIRARVYGVVAMGVGVAGVHFLIWAYPMLRSGAISLFRKLHPGYIAQGKISALTDDYTDAGVKQSIDRRQPISRATQQTGRVSPEGHPLNKRGKIARPDARRAYDRHVVHPRDEFEVQPESTTKPSSTFMEDYGIVREVDKNWDPLYEFKVSPPEHTLQLRGSRTVFQRRPVGTGILKRPEILRQIEDRGSSPAISPPSSPSTSGGSIPDMEL